MFLYNRPVLKIIYETSHLSVPPIIPNQSDATIRITILMKWNIPYLDQADHLWVDRGTDNVYTELSNNVEASE